MQTNDNQTLYDFDEDAAPDGERSITICHVDDDYDEYGGRGTYGRHMGETNPPSSGWLGNPYRVSDHGRSECIEMFEGAFLDELRDERAFCTAVTGLLGQRVACHCRHDHEDDPACHLDVVRKALIDGRVFRIAINVHDITVPGWMRDAACDPEVLL